jgi:hypothetical protein
MTDDTCAILKMPAGGKFDNIKVQDSSGNPYQIGNVPGTSKSEEDTIGTEAYRIALIGSTYYSIDGDTNRRAFSGEDFATVMNASIAKTEAGTIKIRAGDHVIHKEIPPKDGVSWDGEGWATHLIIEPGNTTIRPFYRPGRLSNCKFSNFRCDGNYKTMSFSNRDGWFYSDSGENLTFENLWFEDEAGRQVICYESGQGYKYPCDNIQVKGCRFENCNALEMKDGNMLRITGRNTQVIGNSFLNYLGNGCKSSIDMNGDGLIISGNTIDGANCITIASEYADHHGILIGHNNIKNMISGIVLYKLIKSGAPDVYGVKISNNTFENNGTDIAGLSGKKLTISNNWSIGNTYRHLYLNNVTDVKISHEHSVGGCAGMYFSDVAELFLDNCDMNYHKLEGFQVCNATTFHGNNLIAMNNGQVGISVRAAAGKKCKDIHLNNCLCYDTQSKPTQQYGFYLDSADKGGLDKAWLLDVYADRNTSGQIYVSPNCTNVKQRPVEA